MKGNQCSGNRSSQKLNFSLLLLLCITSIIIHAQDDPPPSLTLGDAAPPLQVREWLKGTPVQKFEKGRVYVVEFWATWCRPVYCIYASSFRTGPPVQG